MTKEDIKFWFRTYHPTTIVNDKYGGTYSDGEWLAFPLEHYDVPRGVDARDIDCMIFWEEYTEPYGTGDTPESALKDLTIRLKSIIDSLDD